MAVAVAAWAPDPAQAGAGLGVYADGTPGNPTFYANSPSGDWIDFNNAAHASGKAMRKFVDPLPNLCGPAGTPIPPITWTGQGNPIGTCIPVANPQLSPVAGDNADYYEIAIVEYSQPMHADLPKATKLRGYVQVNDPFNSVKDTNGNIILSKAIANARYLGPIISATKGKPVRIKYTNLLATGTAGNLFIPVDHTLMGAGLGPDNKTEYTENRIAIHLHGGHSPWVSDGTPHQWIVPKGQTGLQSWQMQGASFQNVPDMEDPGQGSGTLYYTNDQASRLMFYHDHAVGITRLNVYVGMAAGYLVRDEQVPVPKGEWTLPGIAGMPEIPLVLQDKTFVPADILVNTLGGPVQDKLWDSTHWGAYGDLWFPHVYETNQDPTSSHSPDGTNPVGRWDWGPWFWPVFPSQFPLPTGAYNDVTTTPEAFMDTPVVNGVAYPTLSVDPKAYRFRILNAANDRMINLGLYVADPLTVAVTNGGAGYTPTTASVVFSYGGATATANVSTGTITGFIMSSMGQGYTQTPNVAISGGGPNVTVNATARAVIGNVGTTVGAITGIVVTNPGSGYDGTTPVTVTIDPPTPCNGAGCTPGLQAAAGAEVAPAGVVTGVTVTNPGGPYTNGPPTVTITGGNTKAAVAYATLGTEVKMVNFDSSYVPPAKPSPDGTPYFPTTGGLMGTGWGQQDGRVGGVPDPATAGPNIIQIGTEAGLLPAPAVIPSTPTNYEYNKRSVTVLNVLEHGLFMGPAERADVIIDFSKYRGQTLILYNDSPAPVPAGDPRLDYYTNNPDLSAVGGMVSTLPGFGPNTRTMMQIKVNDVQPAASYDPGPLYTALPVAYGQTQEAPIVGESVYNPAFNANYVDKYATIYTGSAQEPLFTFQGGAGGSVSAIQLQTPVGVPVPNGPTTIFVSGAGYTTAPGVTISAPPAPGVAATANNGTLSVSRITVSNGGSGYTSVPTVSLSAPPAGGMQATATAIIGTTGGTKGKITAITITNPGYGYTTMPTVTFTGGGGKNAAAVATGGVTVTNTNPPVPSGVLLTSGGSGYSATAPAVTIAAPQCTINGTTCDRATATATVNALTAMPVENKAIQELFEPAYGRMNATLGVELPFTNANTQTTIPLGYIDPATEIIADGETQIWKITHNGVDTHPVHFHLVNVQLINRMGWDGTIKPPPANELGWKETIRMNPLEDILVAVRAKAPKFKFGLPESVRPLAPALPLGSTEGFTQIDPFTGNPAVVSNQVSNFGWEYVWHCHILGHEENDFMRPFIFDFASAVPGTPTLAFNPALATGTITITWQDPTPVATAVAGGPTNEVGFLVQRSTNSNFNQNLVAFNAPANSTTFVDKPVSAQNPNGYTVGTRYYYRVAAYNAANPLPSGPFTWLTWPRTAAAL